MPGIDSEPNMALLLLVTAFAAPILTVLLGNIRARLTAPVAILTTAACFAVAMTACFREQDGIDVAWVPTLGVRLTLELDGLARMYALLATGIGLAVVIYASSYLPEHLHHQHRSNRELPRFFAFLLLFMAAMVGLVMAQDAILMFVFWDLTAIASFYLIGYDRESDDSRNSAMMALLVTGISAIFVLIGILILQSELGTFSIPEMLAAKPDGALAGLALTMIVAGALAKSAQVPLHFWLPRAMAAPTPVSAYLHSAAMVAAGVFLVGRFYPLIDDYPRLLDGIWIVGLVSMAVGGIIALTRDNLKQILAYSTISQYGYVVFMFGLGSEKGVAGATFYVLAHALVKSALFLTAGAVTEATGSKLMSKTGGLARRTPLLAAGSGMAAAGLIALPLTIGFFKDELFFAAAHDASRMRAALAVAGAALTFAYIGRFWIRIFLGMPKGETRPVSRILTWPIVVLGGLTVLFGIWTAPVVAVAEEAASVSAGHDVHIHIAYHLDTRPENLMAIATWVVGALLIAGERSWKRGARGIAALGERFGPERAYFATLVMLEDLSDGIHRIEVRDLRSRVATILAPMGALVGLALWVTPNSDSFSIGNWSRSDLPITTMLIATAFAAIAVTVPRDHLRVVITMACVGFSLSVIYSLMGAPDVALVAVLVETVLGVFFIAMLRLMPRSILRYETQDDPGGFVTRRDVVLAAFVGLMAFFVVWGVLSQTSPSSEVIDIYIEQTPLAHGKDVVTVILADFRGFDTLGETTVILLGMLGVMSLIRRGRLR